MRKVVLVVALVLLVMAFAAPAAMAAPPEAPPQSNGHWYMVRHGDTLSGIAYRHGVRLSQLIYANDISNPDHIYSGQYLWIPSGYYPHHVDYRPNPCHDCWHDGSYHDGYWGGGQYHYVRHGETLTGIGYHYGVSPWEIARANGIYNLNRIYAGQHLYIPW